jgi:predicted transport protein
VISCVGETKKAGIEGVIDHVVKKTEESSGLTFLSGALDQAYKSIENFDEIQDQLKNTIKDVYIGPTKTYIELKGKKLFGCAKIMKKAIRIGMDLENLPFDDYVQKGKDLRAIPRISHLIEVFDKDDVLSRILFHY